MRSSPADLTSSIRDNNVLSLHHQHQQHTRVYLYEDHNDLVNQTTYTHLVQQQSVNIIV